MWYSILAAAICVLFSFSIFRRKSPRPMGRDEPSDWSPVMQQHVELLEGGSVGEVELAHTKEHLRLLLDRGDLVAAESELRVGTQFAIGVRALTEIGTDRAGQVLERQLSRRLGADPVEDAWYRLDLARGLKQLNRNESLPALMVRAAGGCPLSPFLAVEVISFRGFVEYLRRPVLPLGRASLAILKNALEGARDGVSCSAFVDCRIGEAVADAWTNRLNEPDPLLVQVLLKAQQLSRRGDSMIRHDGHHLETVTQFRCQLDLIGEAIEQSQEYLIAAGPCFRDQLTRPVVAANAELLNAISALHFDAGDAIMRLIEEPRFPYKKAALEALTWSRQPTIATRLCDWLRASVYPEKRMRGSRNSLRLLRRRLPPGFPYIPALRALRFFGTPNTERLLLDAANDWSAPVRAAAVASLGWADPIDFFAVLCELQRARIDSSPAVRRSAEAVLARLGEREALQRFRNQFVGEDTVRIGSTALFAGDEGVLLLWPELDRLTDSDDPEIVACASEAIERLNETLIPSRKSA
jgi:hypothetical protein